MPASITYDLKVRDESGNLSTGSLTFIVEASLNSSDSTPVEAFTSAGLEEEKTVIKATIYEAVVRFDVEDITGQSSYETTGLWYVSSNGPPICVLTTGSSGDSDLSISYNNLDSPNTHIGGAVQWRPNGSTGESIPYTFLGAEAS